MKIKNFYTSKCREIKRRKRYFYVLKKQSRLTHDWSHENATAKFSMLEEARRESDIKYISGLLNYGLSVEKIAKDFELDEAYVKEIKSEIDSKKESN